MKLSEVREVIRQVIAEAKAEGGLPKSGGKLVHLKKEMEGLKKMKESLGQLQIAEGGEQQFVAEYAHMQKFVNELEKIKMAHAKLSEMLDNQITEVDGKIKSETEKVKEMMGLIEKIKKEPKAKKDAKKADKKDDKKEEPKEEKEADDSKKKSKELDEASYKTSANSVEAQDLKKGDIITSGDEVVSVSAGAKTPSGKVEVTLKTKDGKTKTSVWGKTTKVGVKAKELAEELDTKKVYGGIAQNQGSTGSSLQFTVSENTPEYFEIDYILTPNSKNRPAGAGSRSPREKEYGYAKISKNGFNGSITVKGDNFDIGKDFITNNL
jgi:hypothetical protein